MRKESGLKHWLRVRWLEALLLAGLAMLLIWYANVGLGFVPKPTPTPIPAPRRPAASTRPVRTWTPAPTRAASVPTFTPTPPPVIRRQGTTAPVGERAFSGAAAYAHVLAQTEIGPRPAGSEASRRAQEYINRALRDAGWQVDNQDFAYLDTPVRNVIARAGSGPVVLVGTHYDTRLRADNDADPARRSQPVMGANDGASGVGVLLELARALDRSKLPYEVWLVFFDAEDNGRLENWDAAAGSTYFAGHLTAAPRAAIIVDMVGDADQQFHKEHNSTAALQDRVWGLAARLGYGNYFRPDYKYTLVDDHVPFVQRGIPALVIIDFDYPYWHTSQDTADKIAPASLERVGRVLQAFLETPAQEQQ